MTLKAVILDWAGTTVDFGSRAPVQAFVALFQRHGIHVSEEEARGPMGAAKKDHIRQLLELPRIREEWLHKQGRAWDDAALDDLYREFAVIQLAVLPEHAKLIPGTLNAVAEFRSRGLKIGTTTGYNAEMLQVLVEEAARQGFEADYNVCSDQVRAGRPAPWMALHAAMQLDVYPVHACVKVGDTTADIDEGRNAGMWTIGVTRTGNEMGLSEAELERLPSGELRRRLDAAANRLLAAGANYVVPDLAAIGPVLDEIQSQTTQRANDNCA